MDLSLFIISLFPSSSPRPSLLERQASRSLWWTGPLWIMRTWWVLTCLHCLHGKSLSVYCGLLMGDGGFCGDMGMLDPCSHYFFRAVFWEAGAGTLTIFYSCAVCCSHCTSGPGITLPGTRGSKNENEMDCISYWLFFPLDVYTACHHLSVCLSLSIIHTAVCWKDLCGQLTLLSPLLTLSAVLLLSHHRAEFRN